jgi:hypothetical protein
MPRREADYSASTGWTGLNQVSTVGAYLLFVAVALTVVNLYVSWRHPEPAPANPWDGHTLEWATTSPPPHHNFTAIPPIRSARPVWDFNHPEEADHRWTRDFGGRQEAAEAQHETEATLAELTGPEPVESALALGDPADVIGLLLTQHAEITAALATLLGARDRMARRAQFRALATTVVRHDVAEEAVVFLALRGADGGDVVATEAARQERELAAVLARLLRRLAWRPGGGETGRHLAALQPLLDAHFAFEAQAVFPLLAASAPVAKRQMMRTWTLEAERLAPTRPHPHAPRHLAALAAVAPALSVLDRLRDRVRRRIR